MSFAIKKNSDVTYISQNNSTTIPSSDNWSESGNKIYNNNSGSVGINKVPESFYTLDVSGSSHIESFLTLGTAFQKEASTTLYMYNKNAEWVINANYNNGYLTIGKSGNTNESLLVLDNSNNIVNVKGNIDVSNNSIIRGNLSQSVLFATSTTNLTTSSPNSIILQTNSAADINLPTITSNENGLTFNIAYYGTNGSNAKVISASANIIIAGANPAFPITDFNFTAGTAYELGISLVAYNSFWYGKQ